MARESAIERSIEPPKRTSIARATLPLPPRGPPAPTRLSSYRPDTGSTSDDRIRESAGRPSGNGSIRFAREFECKGLKNFLRRCRRYCLVIGIRNGLEREHESGDQCAERLGKLAQNR